MQCTSFLYVFKKMILGGYWRHIFDTVTHLILNKICISCHLCILKLQTRRKVQLDSYLAHSRPPVLSFRLFPQADGNVPETYVCTLKLWQHQSKPLSLPNLLQEIPDGKLKTLLYSTVNNNQNTGNNSPHIGYIFFLYKLSFKINAPLTFWKPYGNIFIES